jgi:hypothetical protein
MKRVLTLAVAFAAVASLPSKAEACRHNCRSRGNCSAPCATECVAPTYVDKTVTCYRTEWKEKEVPVTVYKRVPREVVVPHKCMVWVPEWKEEKRMVTQYHMVPKEVERVVTTCHRVPVPCCETDCCDDGCGRRRLFHRHRDCCNYQVVTESHTVKCVVNQCVPSQHEVTVRVCSYKAQEKTWETKCTVYDCKPETVMQKVRYCERVPYTTTIKVPVYPVCCN